MSNFVYINNANNDLVYISLNYPNLGRIKHNANAIASDFYFNECLDEKFYKELEKRAINISVEAANYDVAISIVCIKKELKYALKSLEYMLNYDDFSSFDLLSNKIKNNYLMYIQDYDNLAILKLYEKHFKANLYNGKFADFIKLDLDSFKNYIKNFKTQANKIVITAKLNDDELALIKAFFNDIKSPYSKLKTNQAFDLEEQKGLNQAFIRFIANCEASDIKQRAIMSLAAYALGGGFGSRITEEVRVKRGLAYSAFCYFSSFKNNHSFSGMLQTKTASKDEAKSIIKDEFNKLVDNGLSQDEFYKAKEFMINSQILKYSTLEKRHNIACLEIFSDYELNESKRLNQITKSLSFDEFSRSIKSKAELKDLSFYTIV